ncbi:Panacea domain-containing protein [Nitrosospira multiformis]|uniref:Panacea domain-containing protein n=1 Tax=Nitrosospira multiformis TaxID=1231 RepID=UPI000945074A|nr:type II toxin-antitoxin system antitoxin SocA domain-containing protein [Nitrosospira multiformis]
MAVTSHAVANEFIRIAQEQHKQLTNMQLQKLVFIAQGYSLAIRDAPLYVHNTHAWQWGPVIPKLYKSLQKYGSSFVTDPLETSDTIDPTSDEAELIKAVWDSYGHYTGGQLSALTHRQNTPWSKTWEKEKFAVIDNDLIADYYKKLVETA